MAFLRCDKCRTPLPGAAVNTLAPVACPACHATIIVQVFPAFLRPAPRGRASEPLSSDEDAGCFYHPQKKAVQPCEDCGRFLCALCDVEIDGRHTCPSCLETARQAGRSPHAGSRRTLHDQMALTLAIIGPLALVVPSIVTAPIALYLVLRYWGEPARGPVPRTRVRLIVAGLLAVLEIAGWLFVLYISVARPAWL